MYAVRIAYFIDLPLLLFHDLLNFYSLFFSAETTLLKVEKSSLLITYEVNAVGPILVIKVLFLCFYIYHFLANELA